MFFGDFKDNTSIENILIKCSVLNDFYSTNIFKVYPVAVHILDLDIDDRLNRHELMILQILLLTVNLNTFIPLHLNIVVIMTQLIIQYMILMLKKY